jgi:hypothetical protein
MISSTDPFSISRVNKIRDRIFSFLIKTVVRLIDSGSETPRILSSARLRWILNGFARIYGFEVNQVLQVEAGRRGAWNLLRGVS